MRLLALCVAAAHEAFNDDPASWRCARVWPGFEVAQTTAFSYTVRRLGEGLLVVDRDGWPGVTG